MAATITNYVLKGASIYFEGTPSAATKSKFEIIGSRFSTLGGFKVATIGVLNNLTTVEGYRCFKPLTAKEIAAIKSLQADINTDLSLEQNFIHLLTKNFVKKQLEMLQAMDIPSLNANPILCRALKLNTPEDFVKYYAYSAISRSIVTSMGYLVQDLLLYSSEYVFDGKDYAEGNKTKWDIVIDRLDEVRSYIEVKSGPNDMDAAQVKHYAEEIALIEQKGEKAFFGITYGKKEVRSVSTSILETYVENWRDKTLIGKELWDYMTGDDNYHNILMNTIQETSEAFLGEESIIAKIDERINELINIFHQTYPTMDDFYNSLW